MINVLLVRCYLYIGDQCFEKKSVQLKIDKRLQIAYSEMVLVARCRGGFMTHHQQSPRDTWGFITLFLYQLRYVYSTIQVIRLLIIINERDSFRRNQLHIMMELDRKSIYYPIISLQCIMMMMMMIIIIICSNSSSNNNSNIQ